MSSGAANEAPPPSAQTVAYVTGQVKAALANADGYLDYSQDTSGGHSAANWVDPRTGNDYEVLHGSDGKSLAWASAHLMDGILACATRAKGGYRELWVDARTFLPLRTIVKGPGNLTRVSEQTWLPRTKALTDMVNAVHIPAGFRKVAPPQ